MNPVNLAGNASVFELASEIEHATWLPPSVDPEARLSAVDPSVFEPFRTRSLQEQITLKN